VVVAFERMDFVVEERQELQKDLAWKDQDLLVVEDLQAVVEDFQAQHLP
jgi:hypothetical protein